MKKSKIIVITGPTATGKSDLAVSIAKEIGGEIISADSRQIYKSLNIGSGKITKKEMKGIPHYLLDIANPKKIFSVAEYKKLADKAIQKIISKGKVPIVCGGTGFYIDAVVNGKTFPEVPPNEKLRANLEKKSAQKLFIELKKYDPERAKNIDSQNKVRLIRAIEIVKALGKVPEVKTSSLYNPLWIGLTLPKENLQEKIKTRLEKRMKIGMIEEVKKLHAKGLSWKRLEALGLEYRYAAEFLQKQITKEEMMRKLNVEIWHYAKRQMVWWKRNKKIKWYTPGDKKITEEVKKFLK